jgi:hypothetical protein
VKIQPRQLLLDLWRATANYSLQGDKWQWGGRQAENSISDAEQLLCLMYPASEVSGFKLDQPDQTAADVLAALKNLGDAVEIPKLLIRVISGYMDRYTAESGSPVFAGASYFEPRYPGDTLTAEQRDLDVVDSFSMSITLSLATLGFLKVFRGAVRRKQLRDEVESLEAAASRRLTAAMIGLLRSFAVHAFPPDSDPGRSLCRTTNQVGLPLSHVVADLHRSLVEVRAGLLDVTLGSGGAEALDNENHLFECGWSWGVIKGAPSVETAERVDQPSGVAQPRPFLYFTVVALDGIADLFSERTRILGLLTAEQQNLARALQLRWDLTQRYWSTIASFGSGRWPLEDIPWRTTDGRESDYYSVLVTSVLVEALVRRRAVDADLGRAGSVLEELAVRGRVTRRSLDEDPAVALHVPGALLNLYGADELGPEVTWPVSDFATALLKRSVRIAALARDTDLRDRLLALSDEVWGHLSRRRMMGGRSEGLWDEPGGVFPQVGAQPDLPSWYFTERVAECLVAAASVIADPPLRSTRLLSHSLDLLNEADHLFNQELLAGSPASGPAIRATLERLGAKLGRAREIVENRPGTAMAIVLEVLRELDALVSARQDVARTA